MKQVCVRQKLAVVCTDGLVCIPKYPSEQCCHPKAVERLVAVIAAIALNYVASSINKTLTWPSEEAAMYSRDRERYNQEHL